MVSAAYSYYDRRVKPGDVYNFVRHIAGSGIENRAAIFETSLNRIDPASKLNFPLLRDLLESMAHTDRDPFLRAAAERHLHRLEEPFRPALLTRPRPVFRGLHIQAVFMGRLDHC